MHRSTTAPALRQDPMAHPSFIRVHVAPLWRHTLRILAATGEVWREARALERDMVPRRFMAD